MGNKISDEVEKALEEVWRAIEYIEKRVRELEEESIIDWEADDISTRDTVPGFRVGED